MLQYLMIDDAPPPVAPFSHAVATGGFLFVTGQMPTDASGTVIGTDVVTQTHQVLANLGAVLAGAGSGWDRVAMARIYLTEFARDYAALNALWAETFPPGRRPARTTVGVTALAVGALVEIDLVAQL